MLKLVIDTSLTSVHAAVLHVGDDVILVWNDRLADPLDGWVREHLLDAVSGDVGSLSRPLENDKVIDLDDIRRKMSA